MKKGIYLFISACIFFPSVFAQHAPKIQRGYAFYTMSTPGMIMQDDNGKHIDPIISIDRFIYVECPGTKAPDIRTVLYNNMAYTATVRKANDIPVQVGKNSETSKEIVLRPAKSSSLWKLELQLNTRDKKIPGEVKHIVIQGKYNKRLYTFDLYKETRLWTPERY